MRSFWTGLCIFFYVLSGSVIEAQQGVQDLGHAGLESVANGISDAGYVVGWAQFPQAADEIHAFLYTARTGIMTDLGTLGGGTLSYASGVNAHGIVVGSSELQSGFTRAFVYKQGMRIIPKLVGGKNSFALGINDHGEIVGQSDVDGGRHAFLYSLATKKIHDLGTFGGNHSIARSVNNHGDVVGAAQLQDNDDGTEGASVAFLYLNKEQKMLNLGTLGGANSIAYAVNDFREVVGTAQLPNHEYHAFVYSYSTKMMEDLKLPSNLNQADLMSIAYSINNAGDIVGHTDFTNSHRLGVAFRYSHQSNSFNVIPGLGKGDFAYAVSESGKIVGSFFSRPTKSNKFNGINHAFLFTPTSP